MADWVSKTSYNNPLFTIYHTLQFAKHKGMYWGEKKEVYRLQRSSLANVCDVTAMREHFRYASRAPPSRTSVRNVNDGLFFFRCFVTPCHIAKFCLHVLSHRHVLSPRDKTYRKIHSVKSLSLFSSNILIHFSSSLDVCIGVRECARALCYVVFYYPQFR